MRFVLLLALLALPLRAHMGSTLDQVVFVFGEPVASSTPKPGQLTSKKIFNASGLTITCGFLDGKVAMETYTNPGRDFLPDEVEALLRTESESKGWTPPGPYSGTMNYTRSDGGTAKLIGNKLEILTPAWLAAVAKDKAAAKPAGQTSAAPADSTPVISGPADATLSPPAKHAGHVTTNASPAP